MPEKSALLLEEIADKLEETMEHWEQYFNKKTREFVALSDGAYIETDEELAEEIENSCDYVRLPNQYDIHEYNIMNRFAEATSDARKREQLFRALNGRKPFRHFKDALDFTGLNDGYYSFRFLAFCGIAKEWCEENHIPYNSRDNLEGQ